MNPHSPTPISSPGKRRKRGRYSLIRLTGFLFLCILLVFTSFPAIGSSESLKPDTQIIIEFDTAPVLNTISGSLSSVDLADIKGTVAKREKSHQEFFKKLKQGGIPFQQLKTYSLTFNGVALTVPSGHEKRLAKLPGVKAVYPDQTVWADIDQSVPAIKAPEVWGKKDPAGHKLTGKGVTVAVIDTGVDYTHPDLGGGLGPEHKVVAGYNFVDDNDDPMDDNGHGTHVAGIIAAKGKLKGVAPDARITAYKVLNAHGTGKQSDILAGLETAVDPANPYRADIVNMSLGAPSDGTDPITQAAINAVEAGIVVVATAGNNGPGYQTLN